MALKNGQLDRGAGKSSWRKWRKELKKNTSKKARQDAKRDPEDPPKRRSAGYAS